MIMEINFDMDGTIADLYGVEGWLEDLVSGDTRPYEQAKPMVNFSSFARQVHRLQKQGYKINIISWLSKSGTDDYNKEVEEVKRQWLKKHLPSVNFDTISIVNYGTPKSDFGNGILFDDEYPNREEWNGVAFDERNILEILRSL